VDSERVVYYQILGTTFKAILNTPVHNLATVQEIDLVFDEISKGKALYEGDIILPYKPER
jgi:hypothetical protein